MRTRLLAALFAISCSASAADREFDHIVKAIESHYGVKRMHIPLMGVANLFVKVGHPAGARSVKLAIFENLRSADRNRDPVELDRIFDEMSAGVLHPMVRVHSRRSGESTYIAAGEQGKSIRMLIVTFTPNEATVVEATVDLETFLKTIGSPELAGKTFGVKHDDW